LPSQVDRDRLLRDKLGFKGYVNSDTGIINSMAWGLGRQDRSRARGGGHQRRTDTLSGFATNKTVKDLLDQGLISKERVNEATRRLLQGTVQLGLFENPTSEVSKASSASGQEANRTKGLEVKKNQSFLLKNDTLMDGSKASKSGPAPRSTPSVLARRTVEKYGYT